MVTGGVDVGHNLLTDTVQDTPDDFTNNDLFVLEEDTFATQNEDNINQKSTSYRWW